MIWTWETRRLCSLLTQQHGKLIPKLKLHVIFTWGFQMHEKRTWSWFQFICWVWVCLTLGESYYESND